MNTSPFPVSAFIARENELAHLSQFVERACTGKGEIVLVRGARGSGKTALLDEFVRRTLAGSDDVIIARADCQEHFGSIDPYRPFLCLVRALIENTHSSIDIARALVEQGLDLLDLFVSSESVLRQSQSVSSNPTAWYTQLVERVQQSQPLEAQSRVQEIELSDQIAHMLQAISRKSPIVLLIDDLQWADSASISLLFHLGQELSESKVLMVGAYDADELAAGREGKPHPLFPVLQEWQRDQRNAEIDLDKADGRQWVMSYLDSASNRLTQDFRDMFYLHTRGHPLFSVELWRSLCERGILTRAESGEWIQSSALEWAQLPAHADAIIIERLARVPENLQAILAIACVQGQEFSAPIVAQTLEMQAITVIDQLDALDRQHQMVRAIGNERYRFYHSALRHVLYQNIDPLKRGRMHQAVAHELEKNYHGQNEESDLAVQLAWHFEQAAQASSAARYTLHAGRHANRFSAYNEAIVLFHRGLQWLSVLPQSSERDEKELELRLALHVPLAEARGYASAELRQSVDRLQEICDQVGEIAVVIPVLLHLADFYNVRSELEAGTKVAQRAWDMAQRIGDAGLATWARQSLALNALFSGDLTSSRQQWEQSSTLEESLAPLSPSVRGIDARVAWRTFNAVVFWLLGYPDKASALAQEAIRVAQTLNHPTSLAAAWSMGGALLDIFRQNYAALPERIATVLQLANKYELGWNQANANVYHGRLWAHQGRLQDGIQMMYRGLAGRQGIGVVSNESMYMGLLADAYNAAGRPKQAQHALSEALMSVRETGERMWEAELYRQVGEALMQGEPQTQPARGLFQAFTARVRRPSWDSVELDELLNLPWDDPRRPSAEYCFERAIQVAEKQQAKSLELRATMSLCRLWMRQDKRRQAQQKLSAMYKWFSEGFDTQDLRDAKSLLNSLSQ